MFSIPIDISEVHQHPVLELSTLRDVTLGEPALVEELLTLYVDDTHQRLERAQQALQNDDTETLANEAHSMKGASGSIGARQMHALASALELSARDDDTVTAQQLLDTLFSTYKMVRSQIEDIQERGYLLSP